MWTDLLHVCWRQSCAYVILVCNLKLATFMSSLASQTLYLTATWERGSGQLLLLDYLHARLLCHGLIFITFFVMCTCQCSFPITNVDFLHESYFYIAMSTAPLLPRQKTLFFPLHMSYELFSCMDGRLACLSIKEKLR